MKPMTNATMAASPEFQRLCEAHGVNPTKRQFSKFARRYGQLARATGINTRKAPPGDRHRGWFKTTTKDENGRVLTTKWYEDKATRIALV